MLSLGMAIKSHFSWPFCWLFHNLSMLIGYEKCILVVHDWGGVVGFDTVLRYPDIVDKFIICNIPHPKGMQDAYNLKQFLMSW